MCVGEKQTVQTDVRTLVFYRIKKFFRTSTLPGTLARIRVKGRLWLDQVLIRLGTSYHR